MTFRIPYKYILWSCTEKACLSNPHSTFKRQTRQRKSCFAPSSFIKEKWLGLRGMDAAGKYVKEDSSKPDAWRNASKADELIKKYGGDNFSETRLDDGLL